MEATGIEWVRVVDPGQTYVGKQGFTYGAGASAETVGAKRMCMTCFQCLTASAPRCTTTAVSKPYPICSTAIVPSILATIYMPRRHPLRRTSLYSGRRASCAVERAGNFRPDLPPDRMAIDGETAVVHRPDQCIAGR